MKTYNKLDRTHFFEPHIGIDGQQLKINEEHEEELGEYKVLDKSNIYEYINELLDLILATNNQLIMLEGVYGKEVVSHGCDLWDNKMIEYTNVKYKREMM